MAKFCAALDDNTVMKKQPVKSPPSPSSSRTELLAPAGGIESAYAAFHYGADAVYLGLKKHSARADALNFTLQELDEITAYAHSFSPKKRIFAAVNTLVLNSELPLVIDSLSALNEIGVDAVIVQDLGVARIARTHFPRLELHASTQMAIHNLAGASALRHLGFKRVTLARELTLAEIRTITAEAGIETEVFIHGALCYSYSGLCLFSSHVYGRSGNRGKCAYPCRELFSVEEGEKEFSLPEAKKCLPFSMKDLALPEQVADFQLCGVSCLKIEGRMKSPLYVACVTNYYRKLLDGKLNKKTQKQLETDLQTIFSRPWTALHISSPHAPAVVDPEYVGHRGTYAGTVESVFSSRQGTPVLRFTTGQPLEVHDGLQIELPGLSKPYGFPIDRLVARSPSPGQPAGNGQLRPGRPARSGRTGRSGRTARRGDDLKPKTVFRVNTGAQVDIALPKGAPEIPQGAKVFCSSSQRVKQSYDYERPKPGLYRTRRELDVQLDFSPKKLQATGQVVYGEEVLEHTVSISGTFEGAKDAPGMKKTAQDAFAKLGDTPFSPGKLELRNPKSLFAPVSKLNELRRMLTTALLEETEKQRKTAREQILAELAAAGKPAAAALMPPRWSIKIDRPSYIDQFSKGDWENTEELILDVAYSSLDEILQCSERVSKSISHDRLRLALPIITRSWEERELTDKIKGLLDAGYYKWQAANLSAWTFLGIKPAAAGKDSGLDLVLDWSLGMLNSSAVLQAHELGAHSITLSPEDSLENMKELLAAHATQAVVVVYQDTPLFISEACASASAAGCAGAARCAYAKHNHGKTNALALRVKSRTGSSYLVLQHQCRTLVVNAVPFCLANELEKLRSAGACLFRADFVNRPYSAEQVAGIWRELRGSSISFAVHEGNFARTI